MDREKWKAMYMGDWIPTPWSDYPIGTRAYSREGGYWHKIEHGWQWTQNGGIFPTPGTDVYRVVEPKAK